MTADIARISETIARCRMLRDARHVEAVLRSEFTGRLRLMFPDTANETWINNYTEGTEAHTKVGTASGKAASRFIDNLVGSTTIEYESDLRNTVKRDIGYAQVQEQAAGLVRAGMPVTTVRGVLSDTVEWHAYDAVLAPGVDPSACTAADIALVAIDELKLADDSAVSAERLGAFIRKHLAREQSRPLLAEFLASDLGMDSGAYKSSAKPLASLVDEGRKADPSANLATELWSRFVDHLEGPMGTFRTAAYVDEAYVTLLARLLSANVLTGRALLSTDNELRAILNGSFFRNNFQLENVVEQDYFGWLLGPSYIDRLVALARDLQRDLFAYDFSWRPEEDLFGRLMAQLARRSQRKLLGQEWTPHWLARLLADRCIDGLPEGESPRIVDMCCGSGTMLAEIIKATRDRFGFSTIDQLEDVATGFDIDPLAVSLAKATWVVSLSAEIKTATKPIIIPVYHADSLFAVTPVSASVPLVGESDTIPISLDGTTIRLPTALVQPHYREFFDRIVDWAYDEAREAQRRANVAGFSKADADSFLDGAIAAFSITLSPELYRQLSDALFPLAHRMAELAVAGRNGIWAFILRNTYRPGLLTGHFNGLVSNPPWLAMSGLADNPYRNLLKGRAKLYGIQPAGQSFLHLELGTMHLLHAIDRYLGPGACVACLVPGTVLNGNHHERLRRHDFLTSDRPVPFDIAEVWQVAPRTFKYPGAALIGHKRTDTTGLPQSAFAGFVATDAGLEAADFSIRLIGAARSAWVLEKEGAPAAAGSGVGLPQQGADLMPRTAVCVDVAQAASAEYRVDTPTRASPWGFTIKSAKEMSAERFPGYVAPRFIFHMAQSENLLPFFLGPHRAPLALPALRAPDGQWSILDETEIRRLGFIQTARRFAAINQKLKAVGKGKSLQERIDERGKLSKQVFGADGYLMLAGAGGKNICAACVPLAQAKDIVVDQTLYWKVVTDPQEAWFQVGMLNSAALTNATLPFNPKGDFSERHLHTLPYRLMPGYDASNGNHRKIADLAKDLATLAEAHCTTDPYLADPSKALSARRRKLRALLDASPLLLQLEELAKAALASASIAPSGGNDGAGREPAC
ncbi:MAG: N-6 DNA methylase [Alphaproteobacteria bacterium]